MALADENGGMVMPVAPMGGYGNSGGFGWGSDFWLILIVLFAFGGFGGGFGGGWDGGLYPWMNQAGLTQNGFNQQATNSALSSLQNSVTSGFGDVQLGIAGVNQNICQSTNGVTAAVNNGFAQAEVANNARQIANMQQAFNSQTATTGAINGVSSQLAQCCCDNRLATVQTQNVVQSEAAATRANATANTQAILDKLCQLELDGVRSQLDSERRENVSLQNQLNMANLAASQSAQTAALVADNTAQTQYIVNRVAPYPQPAYIVGNPNYYGNGWNNGCGCVA